MSVAEISSYLPDRLLRFRFSIHFIVHQKYKTLMRNVLGCCGEVQFYWRQLVNDVEMIRTDIDDPGEHVVIFVFWQH